jgi:ABC-type thiamin/hydroxymethylpyrimidine transport system permease subunit
MTAKRVAVILMGLLVGAGITLGIMAVFANQGLRNYGLPNIMLTSLCFGAAAIIALDYLLNTGLLKR